MDRPLPVLDRGDRAAAQAAAAFEAFILRPGRAAADHFDRPCRADGRALSAADALGIGIKRLCAHAGVVRGQPDLPQRGAALDGIALSPVDGILN